MTCSSLPSRRGRRRVALEEIARLDFQQGTQSIENIEINATRLARFHFADRRLPNACVVRQLDLSEAGGLANSLERD
jgi:hypothetical protein